MKRNQTLKIPFYIVLSVKFIKLFSERLAVKYAAFLFTIPIKFKRPDREKEYYVKSSKKKIHIPSRISIKLYFIILFYKIFDF